MARKEQRKQQLLFLALVLGVLIAAVGAGVHFRAIDLSGFEGDSGAGGGKARFTNMADAQVLCEERAKEVFGQRIRTLVVDNHSTRLDQQAGLFKVFMEADLYAGDNRQGTPVRHYINCFTRTNKQSIASFQFAKDGEGMKDAGGSVFGF